MNVEIPVHLLGTVLLLLAALCIRALLDLEMGAWLIKLLHWIPNRAIFRSKYIKLKGPWDHIWEGETGNYVAPTDRHGQHKIYQFSRWIYAETRSRGKIFTAFGRIQGEYLVGRWYDNRDEAGYFGVFQFRIIDRNELEGIWVGHSKRAPCIIRTGAWKWKRLAE